MLGPGRSAPPESATGYYNVNALVMRRSEYYVPHAGFVPTVPSVRSYGGSHPLSFDQSVINQKAGDGFVTLIAWLTVSVICVARRKAPLNLAL